MSTVLHTVNKPASAPALMLAKCAMADGDALLFIEDGVSIVIENSLSAHSLQTLSESYQIYCLKTDVEARGLTALIPDWVSIIDYDGFVQLTEHHTKVLSWF